MNDRDAIALIRDAVGDVSGTWADLGCGTGTFTRALATILGPDARIIALDRDDVPLGELRRWASRHVPNVEVITADFTSERDLSPIGATALDGILLSNALHFVADQEAVLQRLVRRLRAPDGDRGGRAVFVEYDRRDANPYVPFPISLERLGPLAAGAGLSAPVVTVTRPSRYQGTMYVAVANRVS